MDALLISMTVGFCPAPADMEQRARPESSQRVPPPTLLGSGDRSSEWADQRDPGLFGYGLGWRARLGCRHTLSAKKTTGPTGQWRRVMNLGNKRVVLVVSCLLACRSSQGERTERAVDRRAGISWVGIGRKLLPPLLF